MTRLRMVLWFLFAVLIGVVAAQVVARADAPAAAAPASIEEPICAEESDDCYLLIYTPGICEMVLKYGYWYYAFYCDQREGGRLMASDTITFTPLPDRSLVVELFRVEGDHRVYMIRAMPKRGAR